MKFLHLVDKHFPRSNKLDKIFNGNTIKVSYSGQHGKNNQEPQEESNIQGMSYMHPCHPNATVVKRRHAHSTETAKQPALFTKPKSRQPQILKKKNICRTYRRDTEEKNLHTNNHQQPKIHQQHYTIKTCMEIEGQ